jgi:hypothetical protein
MILKNRERRRKKKVVQKKFFFYYSIKKNFNYLSSVFLIYKKKIFIFF